MLVLVPYKAKLWGKHGYQGTKSGHKLAAANTTSAQQPAIMEQTSSMINLHQLSAAINMSSGDQGSGLFSSKDNNPNTIPPSTPSSYLVQMPSIVSNRTNITSISCGKRKADPHHLKCLRVLISIHMHQQLPLKCNWMVVQQCRTSPQHSRIFHT